jgi:hypothetical protein
MKSLSSAISTALGAPVQRPAVLVQMAFSPVQRWSSGPTVTFGGQTWAASDIAVEALRVDAFRVTGRLVIGNTDGAIGALCVSAGVQDRAIRIWGFDAAATSAPDFVWLCDCQGSAAEISTREVRLQLRHRAELITAPRTVIGADAGFNQRLGAGTVLRINGIDYRLERPTA